MAWAEVLVFADDTSAGVTRVLTAGQAGPRERPVHLQVRVPAVLPVRPYGYGAGVLIEAFEEAVQAAMAAAETAAARVRTAASGWSDRMSISTLEADLALTPRLAAALARTADVVVLAQPSGPDEALETALLKGALLGSGRPCLILPKWEQPRDLTGRALIAWKGTPEAARAVRDALPLIQRSALVRVFEATAGDELDGEGPQGLARLCTYLRRHGVKVEDPVISPAPDDVTSTAGGAILAEAKGFGADLLVMGGFGHSRIMEVVFGGATQLVLRNADCAVLLSH